MFNIGTRVKWNAASRKSAGDIMFDTMLKDSRGTVVGCMHGHLVIHWEHTSGVQLIHQMWLEPLPGLARGRTVRPTASLCRVCKEFLPQMDTWRGTIRGFIHESDLVRVEWRDNVDEENQYSLINFSNLEVVECE